MAAPERAGVALPAFALVFNALVWGISWWPFRELQGHGLHPLWATAGIYLVSAALLLAARPRAWRSFREQPLLWLLVAAAGLTNVGFNWGVTVGDVVRVVLLFYLMPGWSVLLAWAILGDRPTRPALLRLLLAFAGLLIVVLPADMRWSAAALRFSLADTLALVGGISFALTNVMLRRLGDTPSEARMVAMFGGGALAALGAAGIGLLNGTIAAVPPVTIYWAVVASCLALAFMAGNFALQYAASRLAAGTTALVMLTEVVFASVSSVLLGSATLDARTLTGGALIVLAALLASLPLKKR